MCTFIVPDVDDDGGGGGGGAEEDIMLIPFGYVPVPKLILAMCELMSFIVEYDGAADD